MTATRRWPVAILGATGAVGQTFIRQLAGHPWFEIAELAAQAGLPAAALEETVRRYNAQVAKGVDPDFGRFGPGQPLQPVAVAQPPFYAVQFFPLTRKSMGGVAIDRDCRVIDARQQPIPGLLAAGELTGLAGINGKAGLEGTFLGPSMLTGRIAGRTALH
ncbi:MAG: FAD-binding protein, partial [Gemmatimonadaceae bacterium]|nr:FAD-binding protein [Gemmatimonadaceae bacterium]